MTATSSTTATTATTATMLYTMHPSPLGELLLTSDGEALTGLHMEPHRGHSLSAPGWRRDDGMFKAVRQQLDAYFGGDLEVFDLPLRLNGTSFQRRVWEALREIPYGATSSYGATARRIGRPNAVRAVGAANGHNPIAVIVPCHRVIGADGSLTGYGGGLERKRLLLDLERGVLALQPAG